MCQSKSIDIQQGNYMITSKVAIERAHGSINFVIFIEHFIAFVSVIGPAGILETN